MKMLDQRTLTGKYSLAGPIISYISNQPFGIVFNHKVPIL
jgi:hypothetical protein